MSSVQCCGTKRYALRCHNWTSHWSRTCGKHRHQTQFVVRSAVEGPPVKGHPTRVCAYPTPTRWAVVHYIEYGRFVARYRKRYVDTIEKAMEVKLAWAEQS